MTSEISFLSSGSEEQPFHSTPVKKQQYNDQNREISSSKTCKDNTEEETFEPLEGTDTFTESNSKSSSSSESLVLTCDLLVLSAWEKWLLKKEQERRNQCLIEITKNQEKGAHDQMLEDEKLRKNKLVNERYQQWLKKKKELEKRKAEEKELTIKKEIFEKETKNKSDALIKLRLDEWNEKKTREKAIKLTASMQEKEEEIKKSREKQEKAIKAYESWLQKKKISKRKHYSYGYVGGILVSYYDATSPPQPSFCNPEPWICASKETSTTL